jgi:uncharacterized membrane protein YhaH (DUF805 family)
MNEETHFFLTKGRITLKSFFRRLFFSITLQIVLFFMYFNYALPEKYEKVKVLEDGNEVIYDTTFSTSFYLFENITFIFIPFILIIFITIQFAKRMHDVNKSGWFIFIPFINLIFLFSHGTEGNNDYGVDPRPQKDIKYFDELENKK